MGVAIAVSAAKLGLAWQVSVEAGERAQVALRDGDFAEADAALGDAQDALTRARDGLRLVGFLRPVPWVGRQVTGLRDTLDAGIETLSALRDAVGIASGIAQVTSDAQALLGLTAGGTPYSELPASARVALLSALHDARPELLSMQVKLSLAKDDLARVREAQPSSILEKAIDPLSELIDPLSAGVDLLVPFSAVVPEIAGLGADKQFLILFANNTELRPAGGFLGVYGLALTRDGEIVQMQTSDTYAVDALVMGTDYHVNAPAPLGRYLGVPSWYFRDGNWSPDFPTAVADTTQLFRQEIAYSGAPVPEIHGAAMITPAFISRLLQLLGPVTVDGQTFTSENIADSLEYIVEQGYAIEGVPQEQRKDIIGRLTDTVVANVLALPPSRWTDLFAIISEGFAQKELALWSADEANQAAYVDAGWAGQMTARAGEDALMVVDANLASLKSDPVVDRAIEYSIAPYGDGYAATVSIDYTHRGTFDWKTTRYRTYTRVYAPKGSTLISSSGSLYDDKIRNPSGRAGEVTTADELGFTSFGAFTSIEPGTSRTLSFTYELPDDVVAGINDGTYTLNVTKQLGAATHDLEIDLEFDRGVAYALPGEEEENWHDEAYTIDIELAADLRFSVRLE